MSLLEVERCVPYRAEDLYELVSDVRRYPEFIPWIKAMRITDIHKIETQTNFLAEALVGFKMIRERFATRVRLSSDALAINVDLHSGPFKKLQNRWRFLALNDGTLVKFAIDFEFSNTFLQTVLSANKDRAAKVIIDAFMVEAERRHRLKNQ